MKRFAGFAVCAVVFAIGCSSSSDNAAATPDSTDKGATTTPSGDGAATVAFASVQATFNKCIGCHAGAGAKEQLDLSSYATIMKGSEHGPVVIAGDPDGSMIMHALKGEQGKKQMPPAGKLPDDEIQKVADWIKAGAKE